MQKALSKDTTMSDAVESYRAALADLSFNSKPLINMLTMLAEESEQMAAEIVQVIDDQIEKVFITVSSPCVLFCHYLTRLHWGSSRGIYFFQQFLFAQDVLGFLVLIEFSTTLAAGRGHGVILVFFVVFFSPSADLCFSDDNRG